MPALVTTRNFADNQVLFKVHLDTFLDDIEDWANNVKLDFENIQTGGILSDNLATSSVTTAKINTAAVTLEKLAAEVAAKLVPTGSITAYGGTAAPTGWLMCDGSLVSRVIQANLFAAIGEAFGNGDGSTTFQLPDLRGEILRGRDGGRGADPDAGLRTASGSGGNTGDSVGSAQIDEFENHNHTLTDPGHSHPTQVAPGGFSYATGFGGTFLSVSPSSSTTGISIASTGGNETRPRNVYVNYIIKT